MNSVIKKNIDMALPLYYISGISLSMCCQMSLVIGRYHASITTNMYSHEINEFPGRISHVEAVVDENYSREWTNRQTSELSDTFIVVLILISLFYYFVQSITEFDIWKKF